MQLSVTWRAKYSKKLLNFCSSFPKSWVKLFWNRFISIRLGKINCGISALTVTLFSVNKIIFLNLGSIPRIYHHVTWQVIGAEPSHVWQHWPLIYPDTFVHLFSHLSSLAPLFHLATNYGVYTSVGTLYDQFEFRNKPVLTDIFFLGVVLKRFPRKKRFEALKVEFFFSSPEFLRRRKETFKTGFIRSDPTRLDQLGHPHKQIISPTRH